MKIGVISDTHGNIIAYEKALQFIGDADLIVHAGDVLYHPPRLGFTDGYDIPALADALNLLAVPIVIAQGNCDAQVYEELLEMPVQSPYAYVSCGDTRILVNHGHMLSRNQMIDIAHRYKADYFVSGHTHVPVIERVGSIVLMNPGSPSIPKFEIDGIPVPTVGLITENGAWVINIEDGSVIIELHS
ncbi:MAG: phosphodiesterase [Armatimonadota bacterium]|nr:phosphodiesterase [bacterium]